MAQAQAGLAKDDDDHNWPRAECDDPLCCPAWATLSFSLFGYFFLHFSSASLSVSFWGGEEGGCGVAKLPWVYVFDFRSISSIDFIAAQWAYFDL